MNYELFIARKLIGARDAKHSVSRGTIIIIAITISAVSLGLAVMILSMSIVTGFQNEIRNKVVGFGSHIQITAFNYENPLNFKPIDINQPFYPNLDSLEQIRSIQAYALKEGIIKTDEEIQGIIAKGVYKDFNWQFFESNLVKGKTLTWDPEKKSNDILISRESAQKLKLDTGKSVLVYFVQDGKSRPRKLNIVGVYHTGMKQFDESYILMDIRHVQKLNNWKEDQVSGFEVLLHKYEDLDRIGDILYHKIPPEFNTTSIKSQYFEIFGWLELQDMNVIVIIVLLLLVSGINVISVLLILILDKTNFIGVLKAQGASNWSIRKIFLYMGSYLILQGIFWGNVLGLGLALIQKHFQVLTLPQESYYIEYVPVNLEFTPIVLLNIGTALLCIIMMILPSAIVSNISPSKSIKFN